MKSKEKKEKNIILVKQNSSLRKHKLTNPEASNEEGDKIQITEICEWTENIIKDTTGLQMKIRNYFFQNLYSNKRQSWRHWQISKDMSHTNWITGTQKI